MLTFTFKMYIKVNLCSENAAYVRKCSCRCTFIVFYFKCKPLHAFLSLLSSFKWANTTRARHVLRIYVLELQICPKIIFFVPVTSERAKRNSERKTSSKITADVHVYWPSWCLSRLKLNSDLSSRFLATSRHSYFAIYYFCNKTQWASRSEAANFFYYIHLK